VASIAGTRSLVGRLTIDPATVARIDDVHPGSTWLTRETTIGPHPLRQPFVNIIMLNKQAPGVVGPIHVRLDTADLQEEPVLLEEPLMVDRRDVVPRGSHLTALVGQEVVPTVDRILNLLKVRILDRPGNIW